LFEGSFHSRGKKKLAGARSGELDGFYQKGLQSYDGMSRWIIVNEQPPPPPPLFFLFVCLFVGKM